MAHTWSPAEYLKFGQHRLRPALDLMARIDLDAPKTVFDLGCGPGNVIPAIRARWPEAEIVGIDASAEMLARAREEYSDVQFVEADLQTWSPPEPAPLLLANATLQWIQGHDTLVPRLAGFVAPGGVLAIQMPNNHHSASHTILDEAMKAGPWSETLLAIGRRKRPNLAPEEYYDLLVPVMETVDIWETEYLQIMEGENPLGEWMAGTGMKPLLDALSGADREGFFQAYSKLAAEAYPKRADGSTPFPFKRMFIVAKR